MRFTSTPDSVPHSLESVDRWIARANDQYRNWLNEARRKGNERRRDEQTEADRVHGLNERFKTPPGAAGSDYRPRLTLIKPDATPGGSSSCLTWNGELHAFCGLYGFDAMAERCAQQIRIDDPSGSPRPERA